MRKFDRQLIFIAVFTLIVYLLYIFFGPESPEYPLPDYKATEAQEHIEAEVKKIGIEPFKNQSIYYTDIVANSSIGRYIQHRPIDEEKRAILAKEVSLQAFEISSLEETYVYDMVLRRLIRAENIALQRDPDEFVRLYFGEQYELKEKLGGDIESSLVQSWHEKRTYVAKTEFQDVINVVDVYLSGDIITDFMQYGLALGFPESEVSLFEIYVSFFILIFLVGLVIFVTIHLIINLVKRKIESFWEPAIITAIASIGLLFVSKAMGSHLTGISLLDSGIMIYLTFATLLIRWKRPSQSFKSRLNHLQPAVLHGIALMFIAILLSEGFFYVAGYFDTWVSPVASHIVLTHLDIKWMPIFTLFIGLSAAITEEAIFRHYLIPLFDRFGATMSLLFTSILWGVMHIGYDMYPWYLYVLEFIVITGPFFYFVYKRYGFATSIFMHYFYNAWVTTMFLFTVDLKVAFVSLLVMLSPLLIFFVREKKNQTYRQERAQSI